MENRETCLKQWVAQLLVGFHLSSVTSIYSPGQAVVKGNEKAERLAGAASIQGCLEIDKGEIVKEPPWTCRVWRTTQGWMTTATSGGWVSWGVEKGIGWFFERSGLARVTHKQCVTCSISRCTVSWCWKGRRTTYDNARSCGDVCLWLQNTDVERDNSSCPERREWR